MDSATDGLGKLSIIKCNVRRANIADTQISSPRFYMHRIFYATASKCTSCTIHHILHLIQKVYPFLYKTLCTYIMLFLPIFLPSFVIALCFLSILFGHINALNRLYITGMPVESFDVSRDIGFVSRWVILLLHSVTRIPYPSVRS